MSPNHLARFAVHSRLLALIRANATCASAKSRATTPGGLQRAYEAGNICAVEYSLGGLEDEARLLADLNRFVKLYQDAIVVKRDLLQSDPGKVSSSSVQKKSTDADPLRDFAPKDDSEYVAHLTGRALVKSRRHETLVREYGLYAHSLGFSAATNVHPRDLTLRRGEDEWLIEAKVSTAETPQTRSVTQSGSYCSTAFSFTHWALQFGWWRCSLSPLEMRIWTCWSPWGLERSGKVPTDGKPALPPKQAAWSESETKSRRVTAPARPAHHPEGGRQGRRRGGDPP